MKRYYYYVFLQPDSNLNPRKNVINKIENLGVKLSAARLVCYKVLFFLIILLAGFSYWYILGYETKLF